MPDGAQPHAFSFGQVEEILADVLQIAPAKRSTFKSRLQQLQRLGLPRGTNVGRSARARYEFHQLADLLIYLDLLDCGVPPNLIRVHFEGTSIFGLGDGFRSKVERSLNGGRDVYFLPQLKALEHLRSSSEARTKESFIDHELRLRSADELADAVTKAPTLAINLSERLAMLVAAVRAVVPDWEGQ